MHSQAPVGCLGNDAIETLKASSNEARLALLAYLAVDELNEFQLARVEERFDLAMEQAAQIHVLDSRRSA
jgi:hypothetical protein